MLELHGVAKSYGPTQALLPTSLVAERGRTTALIGPSGCGKSTILRLTIGLIWPDAGSVRFDGTDLTRDNVRALRRRMGYVIQEGGLFPHLTARDNVTLMARHLGKGRAEIDGRLAELADLARMPL